MLWGGHIQEGEGKRRTLKRWIWLMYSVQEWIQVFSFCLLCWVGVHCGIYKSSYNRNGYRIFKLVEIITRKD
jgi:hypothetical protein